MTSTRIYSRSAFFLADALTGLTIVGVLAVALIGLSARANRAARGFAHTRAAVRAAETTLAGLQIPQSAKDAPAPGSSSAAPSNTIPETDAAESIRIQREVRAGAPAGYVWVRVTATVAGKAADLVGLVPDTPRLQRTEASAPTTIPTTGEAP